MNSFVKTCFPFLILAFLLSSGCEDKKSNSNPDLESINLRRGDVALCGGNQFGEVNFALSCKAGTQKTFDLALSLLHSFEYTEAEKAFVQIIDEDPTCVMAYWGVAMSNFHSLWAPPNRNELTKGAQVLEIAKKLPQGKREREYLDAIGIFYEDWQTIDHKTRTLKFAKKMEEVYENNKEDAEAAIFYALALLSAADPADKTYKNQIKSGKILESLAATRPNHPGIAHYIIHNYDYPELAELALPTARQYAIIAPASAHAQHMPSHIFTRLGLWDESISTNLNSTKSALCYSESIGAQGHWDEEIHSMDYLVYAYLQIGDNQRALQQYEYLQTFEKVFPINFKVAYAAAAIPSRIALENRQWDKAANLQLPSSLEIPWEEFPWQKSILHFTRALGFAHLGKINAAEKELAILQGYNQKLDELGDGYKANQVLIQIKASQAWIHLAKGNEKEAIAAMQEAVALEENTSKHPVTPGEVLPAQELLGDLLLALNRPEQALEAYEIDLKDHPNRLNGLYGAALAANEVNDHEKAVKYFKNLLDLTELSNSDRPEIQEAQKFVTGKVDI